MSALAYAQAASFWRSSFHDCNYENMMYTFAGEHLRMSADQDPLSPSVDAVVRMREEYKVALPAITLVASVCNDWTRSDLFQYRLAQAQLESEKTRSAVAFRQLTERHAKAIAELERSHDATLAAMESRRCVVVVLPRCRLNFSCSQQRLS